METVDYVSVQYYLRIEYSMFLTDMIKIINCAYFFSIELVSTDAVIVIHRFDCEND